MNTLSPSLVPREKHQLAHEVKFTVAHPLAEAILLWAGARLAPDPHAEGGALEGYQIASMYFDTPSFDVFHRNGSYGRGKYRIRRYGPSESVFLERKLKTRGMVGKRRSLVPAQELARLMNGAPQGDWPGYWYHRRLVVRKLQPSCHISYRRIALVGSSDNGPVRLTLDRDLYASAASVPTFTTPGPESTALAQLAKDSIILELKYSVECPSLFKCLIEEFALSPQSFSKYRTAVTALGLAPDPAPRSPDEPDALAPTSTCLTG